MAVERVSDPSPADFPSAALPVKRGIFLLRRLRRDTDFRRYDGRMDTKHHCATAPNRDSHLVRFLFYNKSPNRAKGKKVRLYHSALFLVVIFFQMF